MAMRYHSTTHLRCSSHARPGTGRWSNARTATRAPPTTHAGGLRTSRRDPYYTGCEYWPVDLDTPSESSVRRQRSLAGCRVHPSWPRWTCWDGNAPHGLCDPFSAYQQVDLRAMWCALDGRHSPYAIVVSNGQGDASQCHAVGRRRHEQCSHRGSSRRVDPSAATRVPRQVARRRRARSRPIIWNRSLIVASVQSAQSGRRLNDASLLIPAATYDKDWRGVT